MDLYDIKRGLRAEIKKRENEQYATFQCNVRQMCKDVLAKLEEQESEIQRLEKLCENYRCDCDNLAIMTDKLKKAGRSLRQNMNHQKHKRCLAMANYLGLVSALVHGETQLEYMRRELKWLKLAEKFKEAK